MKYYLKKKINCWFIQRTRNFHFDEIHSGPTETKDKVTLD